MKYLFVVIPLIFLSCKNSKPTPALTKDLDSLLVLFPDSLDLLLKHGQKMLNTFNYQKAMSDGAKAFRLDSTNFDARMLYANALNNRPQRSIADVASAQRHYKVILKHDAKNTKALVGLASTYSQQMDFDNSFKYINKALRIDSRYRDAYVMKGSNYLFLGKRDLAKSSYETAVQQDPKFFEAYLMLGTLYQEENNKICIEYYKTAVALKPNNPDVLFTLAYALQLFEDTGQALSIYRRMIQLDSSYYQALNQIGVIKQYNYKDIDSAIFYYNAALANEPRFVEALHNLGTCYEAKKDITHALQSYAKALKYNPDFKLSRDRADALKYAR